MKNDIMDSGLRTQDSGLRTQDSGLRTQDSGLRTNYARDKDYWNSYYTARPAIILTPSNFASTIAGQLEPQKHILDIGCGNGRDSLHFLDLGMTVTGIDASDVAIDELSRVTAGNGRAEFLCGDFVNDTRIYSKTYDYAYSRFTLHAITQSQQNELLRNVKHSLIPGGKFFIEARTIHDDLYGRGESAGDNAFIHDNHYRRFIDPESLAGIMSGMGYEILFMQEGRGFSVSADSDPVLLRLVAKIPSP